MNSSTHNRTHILLCHGFGANGEDLKDIGPWLDPGQKYVWHFPQAPFMLSKGSWAWFPKEQAELNAVLGGAAFSDLANYDTPSIDESLQGLLTYIKTNVPDKAPLILGGFSQGAMMSLLLAGNIPARGLILLSGGRFALNRLSQALPNLPEKIFQSHGKYDTVIQYEEGLALSNIIHESGKDLQFESFAGGHEIPLNLQKLLGQYLEDINK